jgi:hypothetical protein
MMRAKAQQEAKRKKQETEDAVHGLGKATVYQVSSALLLQDSPLRDAT